MNNNPSTQETKGEVLGKGKIIDTNIGAVEMYLKDHVLVSMDEYAKQRAIAFVNDLMSGSGAFIQPNIRGPWYIGNEPDAHGRCTAAELWDQIEHYKKIRSENPPIQDKGTSG